MPYPRCGALSMALDGLTLFLAVPADDRDACCFQGGGPRRYVGGRSYIGLREHEEDALQRASLVSYQPVIKGTHVLLRVHFTPLGLAHYNTATAGVEHSFATPHKEALPRRPNRLEGVARPWRFASAPFWARRYRVPHHRVVADPVSQGKQNSHSGGQSP